MLPDPVIYLYRSGLVDLYNTCLYRSGLVDLYNTCPLLITSYVRSVIMTLAARTMHYHSCTSSTQEAFLASTICHCQTCLGQNKCAADAAGGLRFGTN